MINGGILIVDDNELNREICQLNLEELDVPLHFASDGSHGFKKAQEINPDLILLDIMMPVMDGFEMLALMRKDKTLKNVPVLMLTARSDTESTVRALESGANDYLKKPFEEEEMVARVKTLLRNSVLEKKVREDLEAGAVMQQKFFTDLPNTRTILEESNIEITIYNKPYATISGDFFLAFQTDKSGSGFFLGDSCGHGLPAALISMRILGVLDQTRQQHLSPSPTLSVLNNDICGLLPPGKFVAASCLSFTTDSIMVSNGAQPYPVLISGGTINELELKGYPVGLMPSREFEEGRYPFLTGDVLVLYTDGISEATNSEENLFGRERILAILAENTYEPDPEHLLQAIVNELSEFTGTAPVDDDRTIIILKRT